MILTNPVTTSSFGRGARSDASCTVKEFPTQRQDPKLRCQEKWSVLVKEHLSGVTQRKYHAGTPHPNDRRGFTQWFGSCSLMSTLYVWYPASWAPMVADRLFNWSPQQGSPTIHSMVGPASGPPQTTPRVHPWHQHSQSAAGSSEAMEETDSTEVKYKIRQWSLPGATIVPVKMVYPMSGGITVACQCFLHDLLCLWLFTTFGMLFL